MSIPPDILLYSGDFFNFQDPREENVHLEDIAHGLSMICRFSGHTRKFYSVAQHSWHASYLVPREHRMAALLHDAPEAYIGDVTTPLKQLLPDYARIEDKVAAVVLGRFGLSHKLPQCVKDADAVMLLTEMRDLMGRRFNLVGYQPSDMRILPCSPEEAEARFLERYWEIYNDERN